MARSIKCGLIQCAAATSDPAGATDAARIRAANLERHHPFIDEAGRKGVQILCLQEIFTTPYFCPTQSPRWFDLAESVPGPTTETMASYARKFEMAIVVPLFEREMPGVYYSSAAVIDADGVYLGKYRKNHIPQTAGAWEKYYFRPGNMGFPTFDTRHARLGVYLGYDRHFPECVRALTLGGAQLVLNPTATTADVEKSLWEVEHRAHALTNGVFVAAANRVGEEPEFGEGRFIGGSCVVSPSGETISKAGDEGDALVIAELDLDEVETARRARPFLRDRRPEAYDDLVRHR